MIDPGERFGRREPSWQGAANEWDGGQGTASFIVAVIAPPAPCHLPAGFLIVAASGHTRDAESDLINKKIASTKCAHISSDNLLKSRSRASTSE